MRRLFLSLVVVVALASLLAVAAEAVGLTTTWAGAGSTTTGRCDGNGFNVSYATSGGNVTSVTVGDIADPGCEGGLLRVELTGSAKTSLGSGSATIPADGDALPNSVAVAVSPTPAEASVFAIQIVIEGP